jgi:hypothetical protein
MPARHVCAAKSEELVVVAGVMKEPVGSSRLLSKPGMLLLSSRGVHETNCDDGRRRGVAMQWLGGACWAATNCSLQYQLLSQPEALLSCGGWFSGRQHYFMVWQL